jgi:hypothetical protein
MSTHIFDELPLLLTGKWTYAGAGSQAAGSRVTL